MCGRDHPRRPLPKIDRHWVVLALIVFACACAMHQQHYDNNRPSAIIEMLIVLTINCEFRLPYREPEGSYDIMYCTAY